MRKGRSCRRVGVVGAADSRDGWLRPLGAAGGPGARGVAVFLKTSSRETAGGGRGESRSHQRTCSKPPAPSEVSAPTAARPQCPARHGAGDLAAGTPFLRPH